MWLGYVLSLLSLDTVCPEYFPCGLDMSWVFEYFPRGLDMSWVFQYFPRPFVRRAFVLFHCLFNLRLPRPQEIYLPSPHFPLWLIHLPQIPNQTLCLETRQSADCRFAVFFVKSIFVKYRKMFIHINMTWPKFRFRISTNFRPEKTCTSLSKELGGMLFSVSDSITGVHMGLLLLGNIYFHCIWNICLAVSHRLSTETLLVLQQVAIYLKSKVCFSTSGPQP